MPRVEKKQRAVCKPTRTEGEGLWNIAWVGGGLGKKKIKEDTTQKIKFSTTQEAWG